MKTVPERGKPPSPHGGRGRVMSVSCERGEGRRRAPILHRKRGTLIGLRKWVSEKGDSGTLAPCGKKGGGPLGCLPFLIKGERGIGFLIKTRLDGGREERA